MSESVQDRIRSTVTGNPVVLYMKGTPQAPRCGFSKAVVDVLSGLSVPFTAVDVLADAEVWQGVKAYSEWPTIPQVFVGGTFIGGCDIVREMHAKGELEPIVRKATGTS